MKVDKAFYSDNLSWALSHYQNNEFPCLQLVWTDKQGNYPWDKDFDAQLIVKQPLLDRNTDFRFYEHKNLGVFTTQEVLDGASIVYVSHDQDGDWQFLSSSQADPSQFKLVSLEQIVKLDPSVNFVYFLHYAESCYRDSLNHRWQPCD